MGKYKNEIYTLLSKDVIKSTNEVLIELQKKAGKSVNWYTADRELQDLWHEGRVEKLQAKAGLFWRRK